MELSQPSFGRDLPDQLNRIQNVVHDHIGFYSDVRDYIKERIALERQYGSSLQLLVKKAMEKRSKREEVLSIGTEPSKPWNGTSSTLDIAWSKILSEADEEASDHTNLADSLTNQVAEVLKACEKKKENTRKKHVEFGAKLLSERDKIYHEKSKAKQRYDEACALVESTRVKQGQAKDDRHVEKAAKNMDVHTNDMLSAKNAYLLSIEVSNEVKRRFYHVDLPSLEDDFQSIWSLTTSKLVSLLKMVSVLNGNCLDALRGHNQNLLAAANTIDAQSDQALFIEFNRRSFADPPDFVFEPSPIWHDSSEFALSSPEPKVLLQNRLGQCRSKSAELDPTIEAKKYEIAGLEKLREAYNQNETLGDPDEIVENLLESVRQSITLELQQTVLKKEIEVLEETLGDDQGSQRPHTFKSASFVTPTTCYLCNSNIWGITKQGVTCKACSINAHVKCGPKVPSNCPGSAPQHKPKRNQSAAISLSSSPRPQGSEFGPPDIPHSSMRVTSLSKAVSNASHSTAASNGLSLTRSATSTKKPPNPPPPRNPLNRNATKLKVRMLYDYEASSQFELAVSESQILTVITPDDGSGWTKVESSTKEVGLVPTSYLEIIPNGTTLSTITTTKPTSDVSSGNVIKGGPLTSQTKPQRAKALYNWMAQASDEHSLTVGEIVEFTPNGKNFSEGWFEISKDGRNGIIPSNYVQLL